MSIYVVPAILALMAKLIVVFIYRQNLLANKHFTLMVLIFACHNLCEVLVFWEYFSDIRADYLMRVYYVVTLVSLAAITFYVANISEQRSRLYAPVLLSLLGIVSALLLFSNHIVSGIKSLEYVFTAVRGDQYWLFQAVAITVIMQMAYLLYRGYRKAVDHDVQIRCAYTALALMPQVFAAFLVIALMNMGFNVNGAMILPVATTLFVAIMLISEDQHRITDIRRFIPFSDERRTSNQIMDIFSSYAKDQASYREAINQIEKLMVEHKYEKNNRNATYAAERMGMPRSSLYSLFNRLDINKD